ncbi:hypothetical protein Hanom_Chr15g01398801 [Helianthus anomalus]
MLWDKVEIFSPRKPPIYMWKWKIRETLLSSNQNIHFLYQIFLVNHQKQTPENVTITTQTAFITYSQSLYFMSANENPGMSNEPENFSTSALSCSISLLFTKPLLKSFNNFPNSFWMLKVV